MNNGTVVTNPESDLFNIISTAVQRAITKYVDTLIETTSEHIDADDVMDEVHEVMNELDTFGMVKNVLRDHDLWN